MGIIGYIQRAYADYRAGRQDYYDLLRQAQQSVEEHEKLRHFETWIEWHKGRIRPYVSRSDSGTPWTPTATFWASGQAT